MKKKKTEQIDDCQLAPAALSSEGREHQQHHGPDLYKGYTVTHSHGASWQVLEDQSYH